MSDPSAFGFEVGAQLAGGRGRTGVIHTPHGDIATPAFTPVGTKATIKGVLPETMAELGAQALLANAYHLFLQPGADIVDAAGGLSRFMNWPGPTVTDSGGFQVMSLGSGHKKVISMSLADSRPQGSDAAGGGARPREIYSSSGKSGRLVEIDDDGVTFTSHIDGSRRRFTPEISMQIQHQLGADIIFCFDELTTLSDPRPYQELSLARTTAWAQRCLDEHLRLTEDRTHRPYQALFGVVQGAHYEDLRRRAVRELVALRATEDPGRGFDGYGIGGALEKENLGTIVGWVCDELPEGRPRHLLGISEPDDFFAAIENGADTFDCVSPARVARNAALYSRHGRFNVNTAANRRDFRPVDEGCDCYTCTHYTRAYLHHLFKAREINANTLATIHNERFIVRLVDDIRDAIAGDYFGELKADFLGRYYGARGG
ncbi:tRNA guanosine(34) transglycosylase Tgt [Microlunatus sp. Gsoil 973]|uniref:tRNA guanosine(34) transglycosylase Tgt n=1 Tax=Microlunatus sp. Gsoil 973 TaxID=2672569 RepID=UPI0012B450C6|nr:tRNA guanosine(34) transglycosylase Tgt [Microlunatus sp. Gsoil 973]QGN35281.1 tRNA guanosine(34) transglycosylase Tgt [Microlunatus sp. Gsoil 973]